ncbi:MAG: hypothetical protein WC284_08730 [Candidimonas sp.]
MIRTDIVFLGKSCVMACDGKCEKAWGINSRPRLSNDDYALDSETDMAPVNPGTYEGGDGKPTNKQHNKWCARECERSSIFGPNEPIILPNLS